MATQTLFLVFLALHLTGFALFVGTTILDLVTLRQFWKNEEARPGLTPPASGITQPAPGVTRPTPGVIQTALPILTTFRLLMRIGIATAVLAGIGMMALTRGAFGEQLWLRIKVPLVVLAALNLFILRKRQDKKTLTIFHTVQLTICALIIILSVFKFN